MPFEIINPWVRHFINQLKMCFKHIITYTLPKGKGVLKLCGKSRILEMTEKYVPVNHFPIKILCDCTSHVPISCDQRNEGSSKVETYEDSKTLGEA